MGAVWEGEGKGEEHTSDQKGHTFILNLLLIQAFPRLRILGLEQVLEHILFFHPIPHPDPLLHHRIPKRDEFAPRADIGQERDVMQPTSDDPRHLPADVHELADAADEGEGGGIRGAGERLEGFAVADVADNVVAEVVCPMRHVAGRRPSLFRGLGNGGIGRSAHQAVAEDVDVGSDVWLESLQRAIGESLAAHSSFSSSGAIIDGTEDVGGDVAVFVIVRFSGVGFASIDLMVRGIAVEAKIVGSNSDDGSIAFVEPVKVQVSLTSPGVVERIGIGNSRKERAWVFGEWVEV